MVPDSLSEIEKRLEGMTLPEKLKEVIKALIELNEKVEELNQKIVKLEREEKS